MTIADWYDRVNDAWPPQVPPLTSEVAPRALRRLYRLASGHTLRSAVRLTSGNRCTWPRGGVWHVNPTKGWHHLVHMVSHYVHRRTHPGERPHSRAHARLELRLVKAAVRRGYLTGALRTPAKVPPPPRDVRALRIERTRASIARWEAKEKRAVNALTKLRRRARYYDRVGSS